MNPPLDCNKNTKRIPPKIALAGYQHYEQFSDLLWRSNIPHESLLYESHQRLLHNFVCISISDCTSSFYWNSGRNTYVDQFNIYIVPQISI